ncbi:MAG: DNA repair protein RecN [Bacteroidota bacterium]|nr:DNA repair protein RecN [Bacteroidota bacterium]
MIQKLSIQNYALIDQLEISFAKGMTIITGETGAGKSILLGALSLLIGSRADAGSLYQKNKKCIIEGTFKPELAGLQDFLTRNDLDVEEVTTIRREISPEGKSRSFINDTPVNLNVLKELGTLLIEIHSQHETLTLNDSGFQMLVVDSYAQNSKLLQNFKKAYVNYARDLENLSELKEKEKKSKLDAGYFQFQFNEIIEASLKEGEQLALEAELELLNNSEEIKVALTRAGTLLNGDENNLISGWVSLSSTLQGIAKVYPKVEELMQRIKSLHVEIKDVASDIEVMERDVNFDPERIQIINERLDVIYRLQQKHRVNSVAEILAIGADLENKLSEINSLDNDIETLEKSIALSRLSLVKTSGEIHATREKAIPAIEKNSITLLTELGMKHAVLKIELKELPEGNFKSNGSDSVQFLFSANKGVAFRELNKVASGGELSRLMLTIKSMLAKLSGLPTIIFDEIDTGISGEVAHKVGKILKDMALERQVIAITHLPQMAGKGDDHLFVFKESSGNVTTTRIKRLNKAERVEEIAKMLSGDQPTKAAIANAKELLDV